MEKSNGQPYNKIEILDTTMRDGAQGYNINYSLEDKRKLLEILDDLGVDYIEFGNPSSNPIDAKFLELVDNKKAVAFASTRRKNSSCADDENLRMLAQQSKCKNIAIVGKSSVLQVKKVLKCDLSENLDMISSSIAFLSTHGKNVIFDAEHFFDGYKLDCDYAMKCLENAYNAGAKTLVLCDTNGANFPDTIYEITQKVVATFPNAVIGIHTHNDCDMAVAGTIFAVKAGARHVQGTMLGVGERCGNACLATVIANLQLKLSYDIISDVQMSTLTKVCRHIAELTNISMSDSAPYVGKNAFTHKAGMHCDGVLKDSESFEHISPEQVGNHRNILVSLLSGRASILEKIKQLYPNREFDYQILPKIIETVKEKETLGYTYEGAEASFFIMCKEIFKEQCNYFNLVNYRVVCEETGKNSATLTLKIGNEEKTSVGDGLGPVHALDRALRHNLKIFYPQIDNVSLIDYKVRVIDSESATGAKVRVLITSSDEEQSWTTVGVSNDIIQASFIALTDSFNYYLYSIDCKPYLN